MKISLLQSYANLRIEMEKFETKRRMMESKILDELELHRLDTLKLEQIGTFSRVHKISWEYSDEYNRIEEKYKEILKSIREREQEKGVAKGEENIFLSFRKPTVVKI
jgi:hypothetical protein